MAFCRHCGTERPAPDAVCPTCAAGWHADPADPTTRRYFDGQSWTEHVTAAPVAAAVDVARARSRRPLVVAAAGVVVAGVVTAVLLLRPDGDPDRAERADQADEPGVQGRRADGEGPETTSASAAREVPPATAATVPARVTSTTQPPPPSDDRVVFCVTDTTPLNLRSGPGTEHGVLTSIPIDACDVRDAAVTPETATSETGQPWRRVDWRGTVGWVADWLIEPA